MRLLGRDLHLLAFGMELRNGPGRKGNGALSVFHYRRFHHVGWASILLWPVYLVRGERCTQPASLFGSFNILDHIPGITLGVNKL